MPSFTKLPPSSSIPELKDMHFRSVTPKESSQRTKKNVGNRRAGKEIGRTTTTTSTRICTHNCARSRTCSFNKAHPSAADASDESLSTTPCTPASRRMRCELHHALSQSSLICVFALASRYSWFLWDALQTQSHSSSWALWGLQWNQASRL
jgi:hypothetical protein